LSDGAFTFIIATIVEGQNIETAEKRQTSYSSGVKNLVNKKTEV